MQVLYRKYRPRKLSEVIGQDHIVSTLSKTIKAGHFAHAYLFTGPKGVGKTSIARILAYEINQLPYDEQSTQLDIIEIDAASNRRIDEIRELRDKVNIAPVSTKYKVYIIDEVHMLTKEAFNALLKTLEEPPAHVIFILATTELHKLPETIISRTQHFAFKPVTTNQLAQHLRNIADKEKIKISNEALQMIAEHGDGSFRDCLSLLDQVKGGTESISDDYIRTITGLPTARQVGLVVNAIRTKNMGELKNALSQVLEDGVDAQQFALLLAREITELATQTNSKDLLTLAGELIRLQTTNPKIALEICLFSHCVSSDSAIATEEATKSTTPSVATSKTEVLPREAEKKLPENKEPTTSEKTALSSELDFDENQWQEVLIALKESHNTLYGVLRMAKADFSNIKNGGRLVLRFNFAFHQKRAMESKNRQAIISAIHKVTGLRLIVECEILKQATNDGESEEAKSLDDNAPSDPRQSLSSAIDNVLDIFGGAEVLEGS